MLRVFLRRANLQAPSFSWAGRSSVAFGKRQPLLVNYPSSTPKNHHHGFSSSSQPEGFLSLWNRRIEQGSLRPDKAQQRIAKRLYRLQQALVGYSNEAFFIRHEQQQQQQKVKQEKEREAREKENETNNDETAKNVGSHAKLDSSSNDQTNDNDESETATAAADNDHPPPPPLPRIPRGLYIHGPVGTGKSLLMDTFYNSIALKNDNQKQRLHFHAFMALVHSRIHQLNRDDLKAKGRNFSIDTSYSHNPIVRVALQLSQNTTLLCLDEFQVTDVADAMILKQLFEVLFAFGTIVVATSNRPPRDLYEGGLNRNYFEPFIDMVEQHCIVQSLESTVGDYRKLLAAEEHYKLQPSATQNTSQSNATMTRSLPNNGQFFFCDGQNPKLVDSIVQDLWTMVYSSNTITTAENHPTNSLESFDLPVGFGRHLTVSRGDKQGLVGVFSFEDLCCGDLGASDYRALALQFSVVVLEAVPQLNTFQHNRARRFITLIDELYEGKCALVCSTLAPPTAQGEATTATVITPDTLFESIGGDDKGNLEGGASVQVGETLGLEDVQTQGGQPVSTLASVRELSFAFRRAASRMTEMTSPRWWYQVLHTDGWLEE